MFFNEYSLVNSAYGEMIGIKRHVLDFSKGLGHPAMILLFLPFFVFFDIGLDLLTRFVRCFGCLRDYTLISKIINKKISRNENLGSFWQCIGGIEQMSWFTHEAYFRKHFEIKHLDNEQYELLGSTKRGSKHISNSCSYSMLKNPRYSDAFLYTSLDRRALGEDDGSDWLVQILYAMDVNTFGEEPSAKDMEQGYLNLETIAKGGLARTFFNTISVPYRGRERVLSLQSPGLERLSPREGTSLRGGDSSDFSEIEMSSDSGPSRVNPANVGNPKRAFSS